MSLSINEQEALRELRTVLRDRYDATDIWLYGSKAVDTDLPGSDIDVMVVLPETSRELESGIDYKIFDINLAHDCLISTVYFSTRELRDGPMEASPLYRRVLREGVRL